MKHKDRELQYQEWNDTKEDMQRLDDIVDEAIREVIEDEDKEMDTSKNNGGKTDYYQLENAPFKINDFDDFAEWRNLNGNQFNMGKVMWTFNVGRHNGTDYKRELNKIIHYANREKLRISRNS
jgi:aspartyl/asparaginyl-tRNA synthetase